MDTKRLVQPRRSGVPINRYGAVFDALRQLVLDESEGHPGVIALLARTISDKTEVTRTGSRTTISHWQYGIVWVVSDRYMQLTIFVNRWWGIEILSWLFYPRYRWLPPMPIKR